MASRFLVILIALSAFGCPSAQDEATVVTECTKTGERCRIAEGQLGVCMLDSSGAYYCAPQH